MDSDIILVLNRIATSLESIASFIQSSSNHGSFTKIGSDHQSRSSDQIRSDQISNLDSNLMNNFLDECNSFGINVLSKNFSGFERSIVYYLDNRTKITNKRAYLNKILATCPNKSIGFTCDPPKEIVPTLKHDDDSLIMGVPAIEVDEKLPYLDEHVYLATIPHVPKHSTLFGSWDIVKSSMMKKRVICAYAIKFNCF